MEAVECVFCGGELVTGALAINGSVAMMASVVWEPATRGQPVKVLEAGPLGLLTRPTSRCSSCGALVVAPDPDDGRPYVGRSLVREGGDDEGSSGEPAPPMTWDELEPRADDDPLRP